MEENSNMTAERSLEIITEQIERSRQSVAKDTGLTLYVAGLCTIGLAILIGLCIFFTGNMTFYLLYIALPVIIYFADRYAKRNKPKVPASFVGTMVDKTWQTFGIFAFLFFVFVNLYNFFIGQMETLEVYSRMMVHPFRIILLLFGMAITINGYTLKSRWMVWCGIIGGIGGFIWESFGIADMYMSRFFDLASFYRFSHIPPCIMIVVFAFVGLLLPGMKLKNK